MKVKSLKLNGLRHAVYTWGEASKPKLFLLHGWMDTGASFAFVAPHLEKHFYCMAPDLRGFGKSEHTHNPLGYFFYEYVADVHALLQAFSPDEPVRLVGHSMGGNIASLYAGTFPERVSHLVNVEGFGAQALPASEGPKRMRAWIEAEAHPFKLYSTLGSVAERLRQANPKLPIDRARFLAPRLSKRVAGGYVFNSDPRHKWPHPHLYQLENAYPFWRAIEAKCLLLSAENTEIARWMKSDQSIEAEIKSRISHYPKSAKYLVVPDCGHMIHHERPESLGELILDFLNHTGK